MGAGTIWGWDTANTEWVKVLVDDLGHLQVDVIGAGATVGHCYGWDGGEWLELRFEADDVQNLRTAIFGGAVGPVLVTTPDATHVTTDKTLLVSSINYGWDGTNYRRIHMTTHGETMPTTHYALCVNAVNYGWDGTDYSRLLVEDATNHNLRVKLFDGADGIDSDELDSVIVTSGDRGILTRSQVCGYNLEPFHQRRSDSDGLAAVARELCQMNIALLYGWNGSSFDRLRVDGSDYLKVNVAAVDATLSSVDTFGGNVYSKTMEMADDNPTRFEAASKKLRDFVIIVKTHPMLLGETGVVVYPVGVNEVYGGVKIDISTLYFQNANAGDDGEITILGVEE